MSKLKYYTSSLLVLIIDIAVTPRLLKKRKTGNEKELAQGKTRKLQTAVSVTQILI